MLYIQSLYCTNNNRANVPYLPLQLILFYPLLHFPIFIDQEALELTNIFDEQRQNLLININNMVLRYHRLNPLVNLAQGDLIIQNRMQIRNNIHAIHNIVSNTTFQINNAHYYQNHNSNSDYQRCVAIQRELLQQQPGLRYPLWVSYYNLGTNPDQTIDTCFVFTILNEGFYREEYNVEGCERYRLLSRQQDFQVQTLRNTIMYLAAEQVNIRTEFPTNTHMGREIGGRRIIDFVRRRYAFRQNNQPLFDFTNIMYNICPVYRRLLFFINMRNQYIHRIIVRYLCNLRFQNFVTLCLSEFQQAHSALRDNTANEIEEARQLFNYNLQRAESDFNEGLGSRTLTSSRKYYLNQFRERMIQIRNNHREELYDFYLATMGRIDEIYYEVFNIWIRIIRESLSITIYSDSEE